MRRAFPTTNWFLTSASFILWQRLANPPIILAAERVGDKVRVHVRDQGLGIAANMLDRVFDLFVQQPQTLARSRGGLGVGLAVVRGLVQAHGGTVAVHSAGLGKGSVFTIELPAADCFVAEPALEAPQLAKLTAHDLGQRILIVDDNADITAMMGLALAELGYTVQVAHDGPDALRRAAWFEPDIALLDLGLPGMSGYELARQLITTRETAKEQLHLVAVTGYGQEADRQRSREAGFANHLVKPVDLNILDQILSGFRAL